MATGTLGSTARDYHTRQTHYLAAAINAANMFGTNQIKIGTIPAGGAILRGNNSVGVAFNAGTANAISVGTLASGASIVASGSLAAIGNTALTIASAGAYVTTDTDIYVTGAFTGAAPNTGQALVTLEYAIP
jgi:hypothetical protein